MDVSKLPPTLKPISAYLKVANEYDKRDQVVAYYCRLYCVQKGISIDSKSGDCKMFLLSLMDELEKQKKNLAAEGQEAVANEIVGQAHMESLALNLFNWADREDRKSNFSKGLVKAFYSANLLFDVLKQFGELAEEIGYRQRYAKWKATYIHKCMQTGETPIPGPQGSEFEGAEFDSLSDSQPNMPSQPPSQGGQPPYPGGQPPSQSGQPPYPSSNTYPEYPPSQPTNTSPYPPSQPPTQTPSYSQPKGYIPEAAPSSASASSSSSSSNLTQEDFQQASKYCKFAISSLQYEDVSTAVENLTKALNLLKNGKR
eukprot:gene347-980_t